jgi:hypothetical protein
MLVKMVRVDLDELLKTDQASFPDLILERAGVGQIQGLNFEIYGHDGNTLVFKVTGESAENA